jgi:hypothetical protein
VIEKGIPLPQRKYRNRGISAALRALLAADIGDSVLIRNSTGHRVSSTAWLLGGAGWVMCRKENYDNVRVWKVKEPPRGYRYQTYLHGTGEGAIENVIDNGYPEPENEDEQG